MWKAIIEGSHDTCNLAPLCIRYNVTDYVSLLAAWTEGKYFYHTDSHILKGSRKGKQNFIRDLSKNKEIIKIEGKANNIVTLTKRDISMDSWSFLWDKRIIFPAPIIQKSDGTERWIIASWKKKLLTDFLEKMGNKFVLKSIKKTHLRNIFLPNILPNLSSRQSEVFNLALKKGYYQVPKKISLEEMSRQLKISKPTLHEHLRKAEAKMMPLLE